jgi:hypothetical protein
MKNFKISKSDATGFWAAAELAGAYTPVHHQEYSSKEHTCPTGKDVYLTHAKATKALRMRSNRERSKQVYKCHICGHFHLTSKDGEGRRKRKYSRNDVREYNQTTKQMLADEKIMQAARRIKSQKPNYLGYWQSRYRDMRQRQGA